MTRSGYTFTEKTNTEAEEEMNDEHWILKAAASSSVLLHKYLQNFEWKINIYRELVVV